MSIVNRNNIKRMNKALNKYFFLLIVSLILIVSLTGCNQETKTNESKLRLATTTSTKDSGLLDYLIPIFEKENKIDVEILAQGTGQALATASMGDVDLVLVHAKDAEEEFVAKGDGVERVEVMYNDFVIVGPKEDPARIKGQSTNNAFSSFSKSNIIFISRGDDSGTHQKELALWQESSIEPGGDWYLSVGKGMGDTLVMASELQAYTLTDRATYVFMKENLDLEVLVEGDEKLLNQYSIIAVNPDKHRGINYKGAEKLIDFLVSEKGQQMIADYKVNGEQLFFPNAMLNKQ